MRAVVVLLIGVPVCMAQDARSLVARAVAADDYSYRLARDYTYKIRDEVREFDGSGGLKSVHSTLDEVLYIGGKRYFRPVEKDGKPIPAEDAQKEQARLDRAAAEAGRLTEAEHAKRIEEEEREIAKRREQFKGIPDAFDFTLLGDTVIEGRSAWQISATPRPGYRGKFSGILRNLQGRLWIDRQDGNWVRFEADVLKPFSLGWFLARVAEGTHLNYELMPVSTGSADKAEFWVPKSISLKASARLAIIRKVNVEQQITFTGYRRFLTDSRILPAGE